MWKLLEAYPGLAETLLTVTWAYHFFVPGLKSWETALIDRGLPAEEAAFMLDFVGDTVVCTHIAIEAHRAQAAGPDGKVATGLEVSRERLIKEGLADDTPELLKPRPAWVMVAPSGGWRSPRISTFTAKVRVAGSALAAISRTRAGNSGWAWPPQARTCTCWPGQGVCRLFRQQ